MAKELSVLGNKLDKQLGFGFEIDENNINGKNFNMKIDNIDYKIPTFLISKQIKTLIRMIYIRSYILEDINAK